MRKTTLVSLVSMTKRPNRQFLQCNIWDNKCITENELLDIYQFTFRFTRLLYIMEKLGMVERVYVRRISKKLDGTISDILVPKYVANEKSIEKILCHDGKLKEAILMYGGKEEKGDGDMGHPDTINKTITTIMGIYFLLKERNVFEFDVCIIDGQTVEKIEGGMNRGDMLHGKNKN